LNRIVFPVAGGADFVVAPFTLHRRRTDRAREGFVFELFGFSVNISKEGVSGMFAGFNVHGFPLTQPSGDDIKANMGMQRNGSGSVGDLGDMETECTAIGGVDSPQPSVGAELVNNSRFAFHTHLASVFIQ
jgi:hypothetical protein